MSSKPLSLILFLAFSCLQAAPVDLSPPLPSLGSASSEGYVLIVRELDKADFGSGLVLPVRVQFKSRPSSSSSLIGNGWELPLLQSTYGPFRENLMRADLPCGKKLWLWEKKRGSGQFQTLDEQWKATSRGDGFVVWRDDGWVLSYGKNGRLSTLKTDKGRVLEWQYLGDGGIVIKEGLNAVVVAELNEERRLRSLKINGREHLPSYSQRPRVVELLGQRVVEALETTLGSWQFPDGKQESFVQELTADMYPSLILKDRAGAEDRFSWEPGTGYIRTENDWSYSVVPKKDELPKLTRINDLKQVEAIEEDRVNGVTSITSDGVTRRTTVFSAPGVLFGKIKKIEDDDGVSKKLIYQASYSEEGKILRTIGEKGRLKLFKYDEKGNLVGHEVKLIDDPNLRADLASRERAFLEKLKGEKFATERDSIIQDLVLFYIDDALDFEKPIGLLPLIHDPERAFNLRTSIITANPNVAASEKKRILEKLAGEYPEKKTYLSGLGF